jgi:hypothetical protein
MAVGPVLTVVAVIGGDDSVTVVSSGSGTSGMRGARGDTVTIVIYHYSPLSPHLWHHYCTRTAAAAPTVTNVITYLLSARSPLSPPHWYHCYQWSLSSLSTVATVSTVATPTAERKLTFLTRKAKKRNSVSRLDFWLTDPCGGFFSARFFTIFRNFLWVCHAVTFESGERELLSKLFVFLNYRPEVPWHEILLRFLRSEFSRLNGYFLKFQILLIFPQKLK